MKRFLFVVLAFSPAVVLAQTFGNEAAITNAAASWAGSLAAEKSADYDTAVKDLTAFEKQGGDRYLTVLRGGWLYYLKSSYPLSEQCYNSASSLQPNALTPLLGLLNVAKAIQDQKRIERAAEAVLRVDPTNYQALMAIAGASFSAHDYRRALSVYKRVMTVYPEDTDAQSGAAWSSYYLGEKLAALAIFGVILTTNPSYSYAQLGYDLASGKPPHPTSAIQQAK